MEKWSLIESETARHAHSMHIFTANVAVIWLTNLQAGRMRGCVTYVNMGIIFSHMLTHIPPNTHLPRETLITDCSPPPFLFITAYYCLISEYSLNVKPRTSCYYRYIRKTNIKDDLTRNKTPFVILRSNISQRLKFESKSRLKTAKLKPWPDLTALIKNTPWFWLLKWKYMRQQRQRENKIN